MSLVPFLRNPVPLETSQAVIGEPGECEVGMCNGTEIEGALAAAEKSAHGHS